MAYNEKTQRYDEYPRSQFPGAIDNFANKQDPSVTIQPILAQYQTAWDNMDIETINNIKERYPDIDKYIPNANDFNQMYDGLKATQKFFKDDVEAYITKVGQYTVGINDDPTEEEKATAVYSANKVESMINELDSKYHTTRKITLLSSNWSTEYPYTQTIEVEGISVNDDIKVIGAVHEDGNTYEQDKEIDKAVGFLMYNENGTSDGFITFKAKKKPTVDVTIITEGG